MYHNLKICLDFLYVWWLMIRNHVALERMLVIRRSQVCLNLKRIHQVKWFQRGVISPSLIQHCWGLKECSVYRLLQFIQLTSPVTDFPWLKAFLPNFICLVGSSLHYPLGLHGSIHPQIKTTMYNFSHTYVHKYYVHTIGMFSQTWPFDLNFKQTCCGLLHDLLNKLSRISKEK